MRTNEKKIFTDKFMAVIPLIFGVVLLACTLFLVITGVVMPSEGSKPVADCEVFKTQWYHVLESGEKVPIEVPGKVEAKRGEVVTIMTTLPSDIKDGESIFFRSSLQDVTLYVDGELRVHYDTKESRPFGLNSPTKYVPLELEEGDAGKELVYQYVTQSKYAGNIRKMYIGDDDGIWLFLLRASTPKALIAIGLLAAGMFCITACGVMRFIYKKKLELRFLAWAIVLCAVWMLSELDIRQMWVDNVFVVTLCSYWSLMLIPLALLLYMDEVQKTRYRKLYMIAIIYSSGVFLIETLLQIFDVIQFTDQLIYVHIGIIFTAGCVGSTILTDIHKRRMKDYLTVGIGIVGFIILSIVELIWYYVSLGTSKGMFLAIGLMFLLVMAIIKTGQDLLLSEKKKQQAISAKEAEERFLANMSHEIRTPMNAIVGMTEILLRGNLTGEQKEYLENIKSSGNALVSIINDILDISKIEAGKMELVDDVYVTCQMMSDIDKIIKTRIGDKPIELVCDIDKNVPDRLYGDGLRIRQIIINLANNAVKFTDRGRITITMKAQQETDERIAVFVSVADTGQGIKKEDIKRLFGAFEQVDALKNKGKEGTGLGLTISSQLVEMMGGRLEVTSEYGKGSEFYFTIYQEPVSEDMEWKLEAEDDIMNFTAPNARILLVDDNEINRKVALGLLEPLQMQIDTAINGKNAIDMIEQKEYDLVFMDHMMPVMDGVEATKHLREKEGDYYQKLPVIALTANAMNEAQKLFQEAGMNGFVAKPIVMKQICQVIRQWLPEEMIQVAAMDEATGSDLVSVVKDSAVSDNVVKTDELSQTESAASAEEILQIEGIDVEEGIKNLGSKEFLLELLVDYCNLIDSKALKIEKYLADERIKDYTIEVHALKSSSRLIGALDLSGQFRYLEDLGNAEDIEKIQEETPKVLAHYKEYKTYLAPYAVRYEMEKKEVPKEEVLMYLRGIQEAIEGFDLDTADAAMEKLEECRLPEECIPLMEKLRPLFADVAMEEIISVTDKMIVVLEKK